MSKYATGKWAYGISDRSGSRYRLRDMCKEWNGLLVGKDEWEIKEPQLDPLIVRPYPQPLRDPRPQQNEAESNSIQYGFNPVGYRGDALGFTGNRLKAEGEVGKATITIGPSAENVANVLGVSGSSNVGAVTVVVSGVAVSGIAGTGAVGTVSVIAGSAPRFDSTSVTLDSTTDTFDEG